MNMSKGNRIHSFVAQESHNHIFEQDQGAGVLEEEVVTMKMRLDLPFSGNMLQGVLQSYQRGKKPCVVSIRFSRPFHFLSMYRG